MRGDAGWFVNAEQAASEPLAPDNPVIGFHDPGIIIPLRPKVAARQQGVAIQIPVGTREVVPQHRRSRLRFFGHAKRQIGLNEPVQRFGHMARGLIIFDNGPEPVDRADILATLQVVTPNLHLLARQMIEREIELQLGFRRIGAARIPRHQLA